MSKQKLNLLWCVKADKKVASSLRLVNYFMLLLNNYITTSMHSLLKREEKVENIHE